MSARGPLAVSTVLWPRDWLDTLTAFICLVETPCSVLKRVYSRRSGPSLSSSSMHPRPGEHTLEPPKPYPKYQDSPLLQSTGGHWDSLLKEQQGACWLLGFHCMTRGLKGKLTVLWPNQAQTWSRCLSTFGKSV